MDYKQIMFGIFIAVMLTAYGLSLYYGLTYAIVILTFLMMGISLSIGADLKEKGYID